jgi:Sugar (and other) transporter
MLAHDGEGWRTMFGISGFLAVVQFIGMLRLPESPKWLQEKGQHKESERVLMIINGGDNNQLSSSPHSRLTQNDDEQRVLSDSSSKKIFDKDSSTLQGYQSTTIDKSSSTIDDTVTNVPEKSSLSHTHSLEVISDTNELLSVHRNRIQSCFLSLVQTMRQMKAVLSLHSRQCIIALFLAVTQQCCGQTNVLNYAPTIFAAAGKSSSLGEDGVDENMTNASDYVKGWSTLSIGLVKFAVTVLVIWKIEQIGRRLLLLIGMTIIALGLLMITVAFIEPASRFSSALALPGVWLVVTGYSMSFGPLTWLLTSELFPTDIRGRALGASSIVSNIFAVLVTSSFLSLQEVFGSSMVFALYMFITFFGIVFTYLSIPDTGEKSPDEIDDDLSTMPFWSVVHQQRKSERIFELMK